MNVGMSKLMTATDIVRLGASVGIDFSADEAAQVKEHIQKQLGSFCVLNDIDTDGVDPTFDLDGKGRFTVGRCGK